jgi:hypothetical protein
VNVTVLVTAPATPVVEVLVYVAVRPFITAQLAVAVPLAEPV